jgi:uncharacterized protein (DUF486 family)
MLLVSNKAMTNVWYKYMAYTNKEAISCLIDVVEGVEVIPYLNQTCEVYLLSKARRKISR